MDAAVLEKIKKIRYILLDVDGVLTNGTVFLNERGEEMLGFSIYDGLGIDLLIKAGLKVGFLSGRDSRAVAKRALMLGVEDCYLGISDKRNTYQKILTKHGLKDEQVLYMGDDLIDLPVLRRVGVSVSVPNAVDTVKKEVDWVTEKRGGEGAVREMIDIILFSAGKTSTP
jgi:3-deoxy-D-manno-octulosonate 8-phosphate phosphatase (KDO 8-P phosphatase)